MTTTSSPAARNLAPEEQARIRLASLPRKVARSRRPQLYAELAPHLATRVQALQGAIAAGEYDRRTLDEDLLLELHRRICADLIPDIGSFVVSWARSLLSIDDRTAWKLRPRGYEPRG